MATCTLGLAILIACGPGTTNAVSVTGVSLDPHTLSTTVGAATETLVATVTPADATNQNVTWSSSDASIAAVSTSGVVEPVDVGTATIKVTTEDGGFTATCTVTVGLPVAATGVSLDRATLRLSLGWVSETLVATVTPADATNQNVSWSSSDSDVAAVTNVGLVSPVAIGTATISVTTEDGGFTDTCSVTVAEPVAATGVSLDKESLSLVVGSSAVELVATMEPPDATNTNLSWSSSNTGVATVTPTGQISAVGAGTATITVTTDDGGFTDTCVVTANETVGWLLSYIGPEHDLSADSLHFSYSTDGLNWHAINSGEPVFKVAGFDSNHIRDPFILRKRDGTFVYLATDWTRDNNADYWGNPSPTVFVADSVDLTLFTNPRRLEVTDLQGPDGLPMHALAPEAFWDPGREKYAIVWSGKDTNGVGRIYVSYTDDFVTVDNRTPEVFYFPGYSAIDATLVPANDRNYVFFKDETDNPDGSGQDIQIARSSTAALTPGGFVRWNPGYITRGMEQLVRQGTESPFVIKIPGADRWYVYADYLDSSVLRCWMSTDLDSLPSHWTELSSSAFSVPEGATHANAVRVTEAEIERLRTTGISVNVISAWTSEAGWVASFAVRLDRPPSGTVHVNLRSSNTGEGVPDQTSLTFTTSNWDAEQVVTVAGVDDSIDDGAQTYSIVFEAQTGDDDAYNALPPPRQISMTNYDDERPFRVRTMYLSGGQPTYLAHARFSSDHPTDPGGLAYHVVATVLDDPTLEQGDFYWYIDPGLVQGVADPNLVSLRPANSSGRYLRFDSTSPSRWPPCDEQSTTNGACESGSCFCIWWDGLSEAANRNYLGWLDEFQDDATFRSDTTFRLLPALNGNQSFVSFQWYESNRHIRHVAFQVVAWEIASGQPEHDASFFLDQP